MDTLILVNFRFSSAARPGCFEKVGLRPIAFPEPRSADRRPRPTTGWCPARGAGEFFRSLLLTVTGWLTHKALGIL
jgi:hypothetical protein